MEKYVKEMIDQLVEEVYTFCDDQPLEDDITLVGLRVIKPFSEGSVPQTL